MIKNTDTNPTTDFINTAAVSITTTHGIRKGIEFLSASVRGLKSFELFAICDGKARLKQNNEGKIYVEHNQPDTTDLSKDSDTIEAS